MLAERCRSITMSFMEAEDVRVMAANYEMQVME